MMTAKTTGKTTGSTSNKHAKYCVGIFVLILTTTILGREINFLLSIDFEVLQTHYSSWDKPEMYALHSASICALVLDEEAYLQEWVDYHIGIGFSRIYLYDNSDKYDLASWVNRSGFKNVWIEHWPGKLVQTKAYADCALNYASPNNDTWVAFMDVDEFLVLKKHQRVYEMLEEFCTSGELGINWYMFGTSGHDVYYPAPVTKRFQYRDKDVNIHVKSIVRLRDMQLNPPKTHPHMVDLKPGFFHVDTNGNNISNPGSKENNVGFFNKDGSVQKNPGWYNPGGPVDVAVFHHYHTKSKKEYKLKKLRGRASGKVYTLSEAEELVNQTTHGTVHDDSAWKTLKKNSPKYSFFDKFLVSS
jgi:hypothetical protein